MLYKSILITCSLIFSSNSIANETNYQLDFVQGDLTNFDSSWFTSNIVAGNHKVDVVVNDNDGTPINLIPMTLEFISTKGKVEPCFNINQLLELGINVNTEKQDANYCYLVIDISKDASYSYDSSKSLVRLYVPNVNLQSVNRQLMTKPNVWEHGINSLKLNYNSYASIDELNEVEGYIGVNALLSLGRWRIKHNGSLYRSQHYTQNITGDLYAYTDVDELRSEFALGEINSSSGLSVNSSVPILGVKLGTSDIMFDSDWNAYSPIIRGRVNSTSAKVSVLDGERVIYSEVMNSGEFEITEFDVIAIGSELKLVIEESNGTTRIKTIPYTKLPNMLKNGTYKYNIAFGKYRNDYTRNNPIVATGRLQYGLEFFTSELNAFFTNEYQYVEAGNTFDLGKVGAVSIGLGLSNANNDSGHLIQASYAKYIDSTNTHLQFVGTQYRSEDFITFDDYMTRLPLKSPIKNKVDVSLTQKFFDVSFYFGYRSESYHEVKLKDDWNIYGTANFMLGNMDVSLNITKDEQENYGQNSEVTYGLNISLPLVLNSDVRLSNYFTQREGNIFNTVSLNKDQGDNISNVAVQSEFNGIDTRYSVSGSIQKKTNVGDFSVRGYWKDDRQKLTLTARGGTILHNDGIAFAPYVDDTSAIVNFGDGAEGVMLNQDIHSKTNKQGQAIVPYSKPYRNNTIDIDMTQIHNIEINEMPRRYVPRKGATVLVNVNASVGVRKLIKINSDKDYFSASVIDNTTNKQVTYVGMDNMVYISGLKKGEKRTFKLGGNADCEFEVDMRVENEDINEFIYAKCKG